MNLVNRTLLTDRRTSTGKLVDLLELHGRIKPACEELRLKQEIVQLSPETITFAPLNGEMTLMRFAQDIIQACSGPLQTEVLLLVSQEMLCMRHLCLPNGVCKALASPCGLVEVSQSPLNNLDPSRCGICSTERCTHACSPPELRYCSWPRAAPLVHVQDLADPKYAARSHLINLG